MNSSQNGMKNILDVLMKDPVTNAKLIQALVNKEEINSEMANDIAVKYIMDGLKTLLESTIDSIVKKEWNMYPLNKTITLASIAKASHTSDMIKIEIEVHKDKLIKMGEIPAYTSTSSF